jgi:hypothetical protein
MFYSWNERPASVSDWLTDWHPDWLTNRRLKYRFVRHVWRRTNESALCYRRITDVCWSAWMCGCNEMYCDETANIRFGTTIAFDNRNRAAKRRRKNPPFWPPAAILNFWRNIWKCYNFWNVWDIDSRLTPFCSGLNSLEFWLHLILAIPHFPIQEMVGG